MRSTKCIWTLLYSVSQKRHLILAHKFGNCWPIKTRFFHRRTQQWLCNELINNLPGHMDEHSLSTYCWLGVQAGSTRLKLWISISLSNSYIFILVSTRIPASQGWWDLASLPKAWPRPIHGKRHWLNTQKGPGVCCFCTYWYGSSVLLSLRRPTISLWLPASFWEEMANTHTHTHNSETCTYITYFSLYSADWPHKTQSINQSINLFPICTSWSCNWQVEHLGGTAGHNNALTAAQ